MDGGAIVAVVLVVTTSGGSGRLAGALGAALTAPHLVGPFLARSLDTARDGRRVIAAACIVQGASLAAAVLAYPHVPTVVTATVLVMSGLCGPFLTGGISSRLTSVVGPSRVSQRRAQGWDVATYGISGTVGPSVVAAVAAWASPTVAALVLSAATLTAAVVVVMLPSAVVLPADRAVPRPGCTLLLMLTSGALRRTLYLTVIVALAVAALPIVAIASTPALGVSRAAASGLTAAYGSGGLLASSALTVRPLRGEPDRATVRWALVVAAVLLLMTQVASFWLSVAAYALVGAANSVFFAATLAARSEYAPEEARGQVFVWVGAVKITAGSAGTALAGALVSSSVRLPLLLAATVTGAAVVAAAGERSLTGSARFGPAHRRKAPGQRS